MCGYHINVLVNSVTAPIYPEIDGTYTPFVYTYTYLLSPARKWADFGLLEVVINTPFYLTDSTVSDFTKTENGYTATLNGLPENELVFCLSESESPEKSKSIFGFLGDAFFLLFQFCGPIPFFVLLAIIGGVVTLIVASKNKKQFKQIAKHTAYAGHFLWMKQKRQGITCRNY